VRRSTAYGKREVQSARARVETHEVRRSTAYGKREVQSARARVETHEVRHAPRKRGEHNPTRNRKFANANNVSRRFMLPFY